MCRLCICIFICVLNIYFFFKFRAFPARAGSVASSTISATGSFSGDISDNIEDDDGDEYAKTQQALVAAAIAAASNSGAAGSEVSAPGTPLLTEHTRKRPASVPLRKSLSQGGVPESDLVHQKG